VPGIVGLAKAFEIALEKMQEENSMYKNRIKYMFDVFRDKASQAELNGHPTLRLPHNLNVSFEKVDSKALIHSVNEKLAISSGSACTTLTAEPSHVILALGLGLERARTAVRFGLGRFNNNEEIEFAAEFVAQMVNRLRRIAL
jgi:cysteine desulfurase